MLFMRLLSVNENTLQLCNNFIIMCTICILLNINEKFNSGKQNNENDYNYTHENHSYLLFNDNYYLYSLIIIIY